MPYRRTIRRSRWLSATLALGCSMLPCCDEPAATGSRGLCTRARQQACVQPEEVERWLRDPSLEILASAKPPMGQQGARILTLEASTPRGPVVFRAKWRALSTSHGLNDPRKDLAAYAFQQLLFAPPDYVVPPTTGHCFDLSHYRERVDPKEEASFPGSACVFGTLSYWLEDGRDLEDLQWMGVLTEGGILDRRLFRENASYRRSLADMNLLNHMVSNGDTHWGQFVFTGSADRMRIYCVDYTIGFSPYRNPTLDREDDWSILQVPALRRDSVVAVSALSREDVESLAVIEQHAVRRGIYIPAPPGPVLEPRRGLRVRGGTLQLGLTRKEIDHVWKRVERLQRRIAGGTLDVF